MNLCEKVLAMMSGDGNVAVVDVAPAPDGGLKV